LKVVLTREAGRNGALEDWLPDGASCTHVPLTRTSYYEAQRVFEALESSDRYGSFRSLVVTSERSRTYVGLAMDASTPDVEVFSVGPATSVALEAEGVAVRHRGEGGAVDLAPHIERGPVLVLGAKEMRRDLVDALDERGLDVRVVACYETLALAPSLSEQTLLRSADVVFIGAPSAWAVARDFVDAHAWIVVPGATTGAVVAEEHERVLEGWGPNLRQRLATIE
jgi:uroporphyrinogen-III synthase